MTTIAPITQPLTMPSQEKGPARLMPSFQERLHTSSPTSFAETLTPPTHQDPQELQDAWEAAKQFEVMMLAHTFERLYESSEPNPDNTMFSGQLAEAFAEGSVDDGTVIASNSIARHVYEEMRTMIQKGESRDVTSEHHRPTITGA